MKRFKSIIAAFAVLTLGANALLAPVASAQSSASLSIVPRKNYVIEAGKSITDTLTIRNIDKTQPLNLTLRVVDFTYMDDGGAPKLMLAEDAPQTTWSMKPFLKVPERVTIEAGGSKTLDIGVDIPASQGAGSFYSAIVYSSGAPEGGNVGLSASGVTLVFTSVPGEVNEKLTLEKFGAYHQAGGDRKAGYTTFTADLPQNIAYTLKNEGNVTESPVGSITLKHMFGLGGDIVISDVNPRSSLALIGQTRTFTACIKLKSQEVDFNGERTEASTCADPGLWPGLYTASLELFYGQNGNRTQEITGNAHFWYMPLWFIAVLVVVFAAIAIFVWRIVHKIRNRGRGLQTKRLSRRR